MRKVSKMIGGGVGAGFGFGLGAIVSGAVVAQWPDITPEMGELIGWLCEGLLVILGAGYGAYKAPKNVG